ncbi:MAG: hypothetical protein ACD_23C00027G0002 [uncultured bacterium]|nr:MAG: hypothetical protein ACD_23C00027G0002 [uncultured bacterium]
MAATLRKLGGIIFAFNNLGFAIDKKVLNKHPELAEFFLNDIDLETTPDARIKGE